jgi:uncharacterized DUF497 family protein
MEENMQRHIGTGDTNSPFSCLKVTYFVTSFHSYSYITLHSMQFEWNTAKEQANIVKHGVDFHEASEVFASQNLAVFYTAKGTPTELRFAAIGTATTSARRLFVVYTQRTNSIRIISARRMNQKEQQYYDNARTEHEDRP